MPRLDIDFGNKGTGSTNLPPSRYNGGGGGRTPPPPPANRQGTVAKPDMRKSIRQGQQKAAQDLTKGLGMRLPPTPPPAWRR
jgi:hypothetical protein